MTGPISNGKRRVILYLGLVGIAALGSALLAQVPPIQLTQIQLPQFPIPAARPPQNQPPAVLKMHVEDARVTAEISNSPLQDVLRELADRTGIIFEVRSQINPPISLNLYRVSLQEAVQRIASGNNTMFFYSQSALEPERITLVKILPRGNPIQQPSIIYLGTGAVTKSGDNIETPEQALKALVESNNLEAREKAIEVLVATKSDLAAKILAVFVSDSAPEIRVAAVEGLAVLGARTALPEIVKLLKDAHPGVRQSAVKAIALLGNAENVKDLKPLIKDKDASVAAEAEIAIRKLSERRP